MRLPCGYLLLKEQFGTEIRSARKSQRLKQAVLAQSVGISRETLSRIERRNRVPRPQILDAIMRELELDWPQLATTGINANPRPFVDGSRGDQLLALGKELQAKRLSQEKSLRELSDELGLSISTLSRLERGQLPKSRVFRDIDAYAGVAFESRRVEICHPELALFFER